MYEYIIVNRKTGQEAVIYGRTFIDACRRWKVEPDKVEIVDYDYVD